MTTLANLRANIRLTLPDATAWPDATLDAWIASGINLYSTHFPYLWRNTLSLTTGAQAYDVPLAHGFVDMIQVEYPTGQDPQEFLDFVPNENSASFQNGNNIYTLVGIDDTTAPESNDAPLQIKFAETVATGESAILTYHGAHPSPTAGDDDAIVTVSIPHQPIINQYCSWQAQLLKLSTESAAPYRNMSLVEQLQKSVTAEAAKFAEMIQTAVSNLSESVLIKWDMGEVNQGRVY